MEKQIELNSSGEPQWIAKMNDSKIPDLLEFMRIKAPEVNIRQNQLARVFFIFFILNIFLFLIITDGIGSASLRLSNPVNVTDLVYLSEPRVFIILGTMLVVFFYFVRFGYLYLQSVKEVVSIHNQIDRVLPFGNPETEDMREALMQTCRSNYIIQTIVVFLYAKTNKPKSAPQSEQAEDGKAATKSEDEERVIIEGPLSGSGRVRSIFIKVIMILTTIIVEWIIAVSQFMMIVVLLSFTDQIFGLALFCAFFLYYYFYIEYVIRNALKQNAGCSLRKLNNSGVAILSVVGLVLIIISSLANLAVIWNHNKSPIIFVCRMSYQGIEEISWPAAKLVGFLFNNQTKEAVKEAIKEETEKNKDTDARAKNKAPDVPACPPGKRVPDPKSSALQFLPWAGLSYL